jgi:hypothetical protein
MTIDARTASNSQASKLTGSDKLLVKDNGETNGSTDAEGQKVWDNESDEVGDTIVASFFEH